MFIVGKAHGVLSCYSRVLLVSVLQDNCRDAVARGVRNWAFGFFTGLCRIGYPFTIRCDTVTSVDPSTGAPSSLLSTVWQDLGVCPRTCPSSGAQLCAYLRWPAGLACLLHRTSVLRLPLGLRGLRLFLRFRMGCHALPTDAGRRQGVPRSQRVCPRCSLGDVGDERHLVFTCPCLGAYSQSLPPSFWTSDLHNGPILMAGGHAWFLSLMVCHIHMVSVARFVTGIVARKRVREYA
jgi:hypothetical protein